MNTYRTFILVPARLKSERLEKKMIRKFSDGTTVIGRTINQCKKTKIETILITDSKEISKEVELPKENIFIEKRGKSGTERISYFLNDHDHNIDDEDFCLIILGDQPELETDLIEFVNKKIMSGIFNQKIDGITLHFKNNCLKDYLETNNCKMVLGKDNIVFYISRSPIPGHKRIEEYNSNIVFNQHISIVCLKAKWIKKYINLSSYDAYTENNEWLNFILNNCKIKSFEVDFTYKKSIDVNSEEDWKFYEEKYKNNIV